MFEKEAEKYFGKKSELVEVEKLKIYTDGLYGGYNKAKEDADKMKSKFLELCSLKDMRIAELEKANEWYYCKDKLPPSGETVLLYFGTDFMGKAVLCTGRVDCKGHWYKNVDGEPIKWQEIVLPKENE